MINYKMHRQKYKIQTHINFMLYFVTQKIKTKKKTHTPQIMRIDKLKITTRLPK